MELNSCIVVTNKGIHVFSPNFEHKLVHISGLSIQQASLQDTEYLYLMLNRCDKVYESYAIEGNLEEMSIKSECGPHQYSRISGIAAVNLTVLSEGTYHEIFIAKAIQGTKHDIDRGWTTDNIAMLKSFNEIVMMPLPHYNLLSFVGMGSRNEYLVTTEGENGFFTALNRWG